MGQDTAPYLLIPPPATDPAPHPSAFAQMLPKSLVLGLDRDTPTPLKAMSRSREKLRIRMPGFVHPAGFRTPSQCLPLWGGDPLAPRMLVVPLMLAGNSPPFPAAHATTWK